MLPKDYESPEADLSVNVSIHAYLWIWAEASMILPIFKERHKIKSKP